MHSTSVGVPPPPEVQKTARGASTRITRVTLFIQCTNSPIGRVGERNKSTMIGMKAMTVVIESVAVAAG